MQRIGIIGVGLLGSAVAARLLAKGFGVTGYDTRREQVMALQSQGLRPAANPSEAVVTADAVFTILPTPDVVEQVWLATGGLLETAAASTVLIMKDFRLMLEEGARVSAPLPLTSVAHQLCMATSSAGHGSEDLSAVITTLEYLAGLGGGTSSGTRSR